MTFEHPVYCLYCQLRTGSDTIPNRKIVCWRCIYRSDREEAREIAAGMRPWARPYGFGVRFLSQKPLESSGVATALKRVG